MNLKLQLRGAGTSQLHTFLVEMISRVPRRVNRCMSRDLLMTQHILRWETSVARLDMIVEDHDQITIEYRGKRISMASSPVCNGLLGAMQYLEEQRLLTVLVLVYESSEPNWPWWKTTWGEDGRKLYEINPQDNLGLWFSKDELQPFGVYWDADM